MRLHRLSRFSRARISLFAVLFLGTLTRAQTAQQIVVRFLDIQSGKPIRKLAVTFTFWNGDSGSRGRISSEQSVRTVSTRTDADGTIRLDVPEPVPQHLSIFQPDLVDPASIRLSPTGVLSSGVVLSSKRNKTDLVLKAAPGELVILSKRLTTTDRMRREIP